MKVCADINNNFQTRRIGRKSVSPHNGRALASIGICFIAPSKQIVKRRARVPARVERSIVPTLISYR